MPRHGLPQPDQERLGLLLVVQSAVHLLDVATSMTSNRGSKPVSLTHPRQDQPCRDCEKPIAVFRDGEPIEGRPGWFWSDAYQRPVWKGERCAFCAHVHQSGSIRYSVSYRQKWWSRRYYAGSFFVREEAMRTADFMACNGRKRVRVDVEDESGL